MNENTVKKWVRAWLLDNKQFPEPDYEVKSGQIEEIGTQYPLFDLYVRKKSTGKIECIVECKGSRASLYTALGQCMCYYWYCSKHHFYLAIPEDYTGNTSKKADKQWDLEDVKKIMARNMCQFGLLSVSLSGRVRYVRDALRYDRASHR